MKSYVSMEQKKCLVCCKDFGNGTILLDRRLREKFETYTLTGWDLCPEHQKLFNDGFIALVGVDKAKSKILSNGNLNPEDAYRTGEIAHLRFEAFDRIMNVSGKDPEGKRFPVLFCEPDVIRKLEKISKEVPNDN
jgi:hypothetical protein